MATELRELQLPVSRFISTFSELTIQPVPSTPCAMNLVGHPLTFTSLAVADQRR